MVKVWQSIDEYLPLDAVDRVIPLRHLFNAWRWAKLEPDSVPTLRETVTPGLLATTDNMAVVELDLKRGTARYCIVGQKLVRLLGKNPTGKTVHETYAHPIGDEVYAALQQVARTGQPTFYNREFIMLGRSFGYFRLLLPVARSQAGVFVLMGIYPSSAKFLNAAQWQAQLTEAEQVAQSTGTIEPVWL
jgi:hypothetical protein